MLRQIGSILSSLQGAPGGVHRRVWDELSPWFGHLAGEAAQKWLPRLGASLPCAVPFRHAKTGVIMGKCPGKAIAACLTCGRWVCLGHAFVDQYGEAVCYDCVASAVDAQHAQEQSAAGGGTNHQSDPKAPKQPPPHDIAWARRLLHLKRGATLEDVKRAHRKLSAKYHPDRFKTDPERAEGEAKFKEVQRAFEIMKLVLEQEAA